MAARYMQKIDTGEVFIYQKHICDLPGYKEIPVREAESLLKKVQKKAAPVIPPQGRHAEEISQEVQDAQARAQQAEQAGDAAQGEASGDEEDQSQNPKKGKKGAARRVPRAE